MAGANDQTSLSRETFERARDRNKILNDRGTLGPCVRARWVDAGPGFNSRKIQPRRAAPQRAAPVPRIDTTFGRHANVPRWRSLGRRLAPCVVRNIDRGRRIFRSRGLPNNARAAGSYGIATSPRNSSRDVRSAILARQLLVCGAERMNYRKYSPPLV